MGLDSAFAALVEVASHTESPVWNEPLVVQGAQIWRNGSVQDGFEIGKNDRQNSRTLQRTFKGTPTQHSVC